MKQLSLLAAAAIAPAILAAQRPQAPRQPVTIVPAPTPALPRTRAPRPTAPAITANDLMTRLYIFADDSMMGREAGTLGNVKGTDYIAAEAKRLGLVPAGDEGTYFQTLPFMTRTVDTTSRLVVGGAPLAFGTDWVPSGGGAASKSDLPVVYGGIFGDSANVISAEQAAGKFVVFAGPTGAASQRAIRNVQQRLLPTAAAMAIVVAPQMLGFARRPSMFVDEQGTASQAASGTAVVLLTADAAARMFDQPLAQLTPGAAGRTASLDSRIVIRPVPYPARNVVAILPGSDPALRGQFVAVGAHNDHVGMNTRPVDHDSLRLYNHIVRPGGAEDARNQATPEQQAEVNAQLAAFRAAHPGAQRLDSIFNGADDDGSGSVSVLEIAERLSTMKTKPKRSIVFVWHVGEEKGLLGSAWFTDHPTVPRDSIVAQLNIDMDGRGDAWDVTGLTKDGAPIHGGANYLQLVGSRRLSSELGDLVEKVNVEGKHGFTFDYAMDANGHPMNIYCRSDHYEYARYGVPITFFTTGGHSDYHQVTDEPMYIDYDHMARVTNLVTDIALRVANLDHRVAVDQPKPDPRGRCQQ